MSKLFTYTHKVSKRSRGVRLAVHGDGTVVVTAPRWIGKRMVQRFVVEKSDWILDKLRRVSTRPKKILDTRSRSEYLEHKERARILVARRLEYFNAQYGFAYKRISIRNQKTRWGSCSKQGNLSFHYKIAFLPENLADYIVVHELCHLKEMNHSKQFWDLVARALPDHKERRKQIRSL
ncbi:MAG: hypothetical protein A3C02_04255 [Candidatus Andersenbacteria bacterium RIFCSPHIGHO2_02_FULL_45_11]|uniref:YgjP-like metallopeptidase domain-containing protein n=1 Tax=Candidatus Andersenbacteria bacterium RIFCSPHIGHO2_12_FULL_45_11 TaxID=1797281 RepID=A0A1G1X0A0_9BACT|nr:MAG: hypothetical protein A3C02_04255 [Candidatus Andersenbacteria bacterium RIFCSPHIGHO2_02_FULL_45_11]OGY33429.1 MAG: hypothetical protein A3D99_04780 [Candidatus Andersenbacteria bacterium RIFCSPHIGHO2_12_FULL_45_11]